MRSKRAPKRQVQTDLVYKSRVISRMINALMLDGKKSLAQTILYQSLEKLSEDQKEATQLFEQAVKNVMPAQEVRSRRVGGATYQVPMPLRFDRAEALALRWIVDASRNKKGKPMVDRLYEELKAALENTGNAIRKKEDTHKMAESNKAFAHFRF